jgi:nucleoside-diphosphate-sugar epimerase
MTSLSAANPPAPTRPCSPVRKRHPIIEEDLQRITSESLPWEEFRNKTVLITGCNGYIAAYMVETLLFLNEAISDQNTTVIGLARSRERAEGRFSHHASRRDLQLLIQDVCLPLPPDLRADFAIHAASPAQPRTFGADPVGTILPNVLGTHHVLSMSQRSRSRAVLFLSSGEVYGNVDRDGGSIEESDYGRLDPLEVRSCYGESKRLGETMCACWWHQFQVPAKVARLGHTYGPGMPLSDGRVFTDFVGNVVRHQPIFMRSDGSVQRPFCYLADAVTGLFTVLLKGQPGQAYNVANDGTMCSVGELADRLVSLFPERHLSVHRELHNQAADFSCKLRGSRPDVSKVASLGWRPKIGIDEGFRRTVQSFDPPSVAP